MLSIYFVAMLHIKILEKEVGTITRNSNILYLYFQPNLRFVVIFSIIDSKQFLDDLLQNYFESILKI